MLESPAQTKHCAMGGGGYSDLSVGAKRGRRRCLPFIFFSQEQVRFKGDWAERCVSIAAIEFFLCWCHQRDIFATFRTNMAPDQLKL